MRPLAERDERSVTVGSSRVNRGLMSNSTRAPHVFRKAGTADSVTAGDVVVAGSDALPDRYDFVLQHGDTEAGTAWSTWC